MKYIGRKFEYLTNKGTYYATCNSIEFHQGLKKWLFIGTSPYGHPVRLTKDEISRFL